VIQLFSGAFASIHKKEMYARLFNY
jgi:hypothetical protein